LALLSFGEEAEEEEREDPNASVRMASSHQFPSTMIAESKKRKNVEDLNEKDESQTSNHDNNTLDDITGSIPNSMKRAKNFDIRMRREEMQQMEHGKGQENKDNDDDDNNDDDDDDDDSENEEVKQQSSKQAQSFSDMMRARIQEAKNKYYPKKTTTTTNAQGKTANNDNEAKEESKPKLKKLSFKKGPSVSTKDSIPLPRRRIGANETKILQKLELFRKALTGPISSEEDEWKTHAMVFEKESKVIDPMLKTEEHYDVVDPLRNSKNKEKSWHERRLDKGSKKSEKW